MATATARRRSLAAHGSSFLSRLNTSGASIALDRDKKLKSLAVILRTLNQSQQQTCLTISVPIEEQISHQYYAEHKQPKCRSENARNNHLTRRFLPTKEMQRENDAAQTNHSINKAADKTYPPPANQELLALR